MALQGTLDTFSLPDVLRLLATTAKTGRLRVEGDRGHGSVWLLDGAVVASDADHALNGAPSDEVIFELLRFHAGSFEFAADEEPSQPAKPEDVEGLLRRAGALLSEWHELEVVVPSLEHRVTLTTDLPADEVSIDAERWRSVVAVAGAQNVAGLASALRLSELGVSRVVRDLVDLGVAQVDEPDSAPSTTSTTSATMTRSSSRGSGGPSLPGRRASRSDDPIGPAPHTDPTTTGEITRAGWLQPDTSSNPQIDASSDPAPHETNGRSTLGGLRGRSSASGAATTDGGLTSRLGRSSRSLDGDGQRGSPSSDAKPPTAPPERTTGGLTSRLLRNDRPSAMPPSATDPSASATGEPSTQPAPTGRNGLPRRSRSAPKRPDTGRFPSPRSIDTGQIRAVSSAALPADLHWAAEDDGADPGATTQPVGAVPTSRRGGDREPAPHVTAMSSEARAAVEATVGPAGGTQGARTAPPADDMAQRGRLIDFLTSVRN